MAIVSSNPTTIGDVLYLHNLMVNRRNQLIVNINKCEYPEILNIMYKELNELNRDIDQLDQLKVSDFVIYLWDRWINKDYDHLH